MSWYHQILNFTDLVSIINAIMTWYHQISKKEKHGSEVCADSNNVLLFIWTISK